MSFKIQNEKKYRDALKKKKEEKHRESEYKTLLGLKKKREKKPRSELQKISDKIFSKNITGVEEIRMFIGSEFKKFDEITNKFLSTIAQSKVINGKLVISDTLANRPLLYKLKVKAGSRNWISNDGLFLSKVFKQAFPKDVGAVDLSGNFQIKNVTVVSVPFLYEGETKKGFIQDNKENFFCFGLEALEGEELTNTKNVLFNFNNGTFKYKYNNYTYIAKDYNNCTVITFDNQTANALNNYKNQKIFNMPSLKKRELREKVMEVKNKPRYFYSKIKPEFFCPAFTLLNQSVEFSFLYDIALDYNEMFTNIINSLISTKAPGLPTDFVYWDNVEELIELYSVIAVVGVSFGMPVDFSAYFSNCCDSYSQIRIPIGIWGKKMMDLQRIVTEFFNSFSTKLNYDKLTDMREKILKINDDYNKLTKDPSYEAVYNFFTKDGFLGRFNIYIKNQLDNKGMQAFLDNFLGVLTKIELLQSGGLVEEIEKMGNAIYYSSLSEGDMNNCLFPILLSPGAFYGASIKPDSGDRKKLFEEIVTNFVIKAGDKKEKDDASRGNLLEVMKNLPFYRNAILNNNAQMFINNNMESLSKNGFLIGDINQLKELLYKRLVKRANVDPKTAGELYTAITNNLSDLSKLKDITIDSKYLENMANEIIKDAIDKKNGIVKEKKKKPKIRNRLVAPRSKIKSKEAKELDKQEPGAGNNYGDMLTNVLLENTEDMVNDGQFKIQGKEFAFSSGPFDSRDINPLSQYLTEIIDKSGIYAEEYKPEMKNFMYKEHPYNIMKNYPIAPKIMTRVAKAIGLPTVQEAFNKGIDVGKLLTIPEEKSRDLRIVNGLLMGQYPMEKSPDNIRALKDIKLGDIEIDENAESKAEDFYNHQWNIIVEDFAPWSATEEVSKLSSFPGSGAGIEEIEI